MGEYGNQVGIPTWDMTVVGRAFIPCFDLGFDSFEMKISSI